MALFHFHVTQIKRSAGQSAVASAAYRAGEKLHSEYYGEDSDYTKKKGVITAVILLPSHAPPEYSDRERLWNAVEKAERGKNAQLAYSFDIALQNELSLDENIALTRLSPRHRQTAAKTGVMTPFLNRRTHKKSRGKNSRSRRKNMNWKSERRTFLWN